MTLTLQDICVSNSCKRKALDDLCRKPEKSWGWSYLQTVKRIVLLNWILNTSGKHVDYKEAKLADLSKNIEQTLQQLNGMSVKTGKREICGEIDHENKIWLSDQYWCLKEKYYGPDAWHGTFEYCCTFFQRLFTIFMVRTPITFPFCFVCFRTKRANCQIHHQ